MDASSSCSKIFENSLGEKIKLPNTISVKKFVESRIKEISALSNAINNPQKTAMVFQQLPKHMRRRVMSHTVKRMPKRLRIAHSALLDKCGAKDPGKRPSRKFRRRPKNLMSEYNRRQRDNVWLETHMWHAKRFHMINIWGYRIANYPNDKSFRACYRASAYHCLIQDISFYVCIEINGEEDAILKGLSLIISNGSSFKARPYLRGAREGEVTVCHSQSKIPIGRVKYMWKPVFKDEQRCIWIWSHPVFYSVLFDELKTIFSTFPRVTINLLKDQLNRFRLVGPKALKILSTCLVACSAVDGRTDWTSSYFTNDERLNDLSVQLEYYSQISEHQADQLPPHSILPVTGFITLPTTPVKLTSQGDMSDDFPLNPVKSCDSPLWYKDMRSLMSAKGIKRPCVSVTVIHNPPSLYKDTNYGGGIDVICAANCGMPLWLGLILRGARAGGLRESESVACLKAEPPVIPFMSKYERDRLTQAATRKYFRLPPAKRQNYIKMGAVTPFDCPWELLQREWSESELVRICITLKEKGTLRRCSMICLPNTGDCLRPPPSEPPHPDPNQKKRTESRCLHKKKLKSAAAERKRLRQEKVQNIPTSSELVEDQKKIMERLWVPECTTVRNTGSRQIMGFVVNGFYSYLDGKYCGLGYVASESLEQLKKVTRQNIILTRNTDSLQYRFATFQILPT